MLRLLLTAAILFACVIAGQSQTRVRVVDQTNREPLPCAHVSVYPVKGGKGLTQMSDAEGRTDLPTAFLSENKRFVIKVTYIGFHTYSDTCMAQREITVALVPEREKLHEVVVTGQYAPGSPEKAVHRIRVIGADRIKSLAATTLDEVLAYETSIRVSRDNILGSSLSMQGLSGENVKILIDGVPVIGRMDGSIDLSQINLNDIQQVEIVEGPMSVIFGTNALAGTINLITRKEIREKVSAGLSSYFENIGTWDLNGQAAFRQGKTSFLISGGRNFFDGWGPDDALWPEFGKTRADSTRYKNWKPKEQRQVRFQVFRDLGTIKAGYKAELFSELITNRGMPIAPYFEKAWDDYYRTVRFDQSVSANGTFGTNLRFNGVASYNLYKRTKNTYLKDLTNLTEVLSATSGAQDSTDYYQAMSRASLATNYPDRWYNLEGGYDASFESASGVRIESRGKSMGDYSLFSTGEFRFFGDLVVRPGVRLTYNTLYPAPVSPSINLKYAFGNSTLRLSFAQGFRAPSIKELYFNFVDINHNIVGNQDLKAESSNNYSLGYSYKRIVNQKVFQAELSGFYNDIHDKIELAQVAGSTGNQYSYVNIGKNRTTGLNLGLSMMWQHFRITANFTRTGQYNSLTEAMDTRPFNYYNELKANSSYEWKESGVVLNIFYKFQGSLQGFSLNADNEVEQTYIGKYHMGEFTLSKSFFSGQFTVSGGFKNLFNVKSVRSVMTSGAHSDSNGSMPVGMGRLVFFKIDYKFLRS